MRVIDIISMVALICNQAPTQNAYIHTLTHKHLYIPPKYLFDFWLKWVWAQLVYLQRKISSIILVPIRFDICDSLGLPNMPFCEER